MVIRRYRLEGIDYRLVMEGSLFCRLPTDRIVNCWVTARSLGFNYIS